MRNFARNLEIAIVNKIIFIHTLDPIEWRNTAFCLSQFNYSEKSLRKLLELYDDWKEKLSIENINERFLQIYSKVKKSQKAEIRAQFEEFEVKLQLKVDDETVHLLAANKLGKNKKVNKK